MELQEIYEKFGGDYNDAMKRLASDRLIRKYLGKMKDLSNIETIETSLASEDYETAFREAHNLKGLCANLGITKMGEHAVELTEMLRNGKPEEDANAMLEKVKEDYEELKAALAEL